MHAAAFLCRALAVALLVLTLCRPFILRETEGLHVIFLVDASESVDLASAREALDEVDAAIETLKASDSYSVGMFGSEVRFFEDVEALRSALRAWEEGVPDADYRSESRLADGLLASRLRFPAAKSRRIVLFSDGQETHRSVAQALDTLTKEEVNVLWRPLPGLQAPEAAVVRLEPSAPSAFQGEVVRMRATLAANQAQSAKLRILHKGVAVRDVDVDLEAGETEVDVEVPMFTPGESLWTAELVPDEDHFPLNNQDRATVRVTGKPRVLMLHEKPRDLRNLKRALAEQDIEVDVRGTRGLPESMEGLLAFDAIVLSDIPATVMTPQQMSWVKRYVEDFGGGLAMLGSENSYGLGGYYKTPVEEVLPLVSRFEKEKEKPSLAMALVMDKSGSMQGMPIALARQAAKASVELLSARDQIGVVGFDGQPQIISEMRPAADIDAIHSAIDSLAASGGTDVYMGMLAGKDMLDNATAKIKHMIVLTDGQTGAADFQGLVQGMVESGITVSSVALGPSAARELLAGIAELGKGRYYETVDPATVPQIFTKETMQASRSAIKEDLYVTLVTGDHPLLVDYSEEDLPFSLGYVMTEPKPTSQVILAAETGDPLLALGRYGLGTGLAYTSDLSERWGAEWLAWEECGKFWAQVFRAILRKSGTRGMQVETAVRGETWQIDITRQDANRLPVSGITWESQAVNALGKALPVTVHEVGLGRYRAEVPLAGEEQLTLRLHDTDDDLLKVLHYHQPYPKEYALAQEVPETVNNLARMNAEEIRSGIAPLRTRQPVTAGFALAALALLLFGIVLRRV